MFRIVNPQGVPFHVQFEDDTVTIYDTRLTENTTDAGYLVSSMYASTMFSKVKNGGDIWFSKWVPNALPDWWLSEQNAREIWKWVESQIDSTQIPKGMYMSDGNVAQVGQRVEFIWSRRCLKGTIVAILNPHDLGDRPSNVPKSRWKVSTEYYVLWHRALVEVIDPKNGLPTYYGIAIIRQSRSSLRLIDSIKTTA